MTKDDETTETIYRDMLGRPHSTNWERIIADIELAAEPKAFMVEALNELRHVVLLSLPNAKSQKKR